MASPIKYESKQARHSLADSNYILIPHLSKRSEESLKLVNMTVSHKQTVCVNVLFIVISDLKCSVLSPFGWFISHESLLI